MLLEYHLKFHNVLGQLSTMIFDTTHVKNTIYSLQSENLRCNNYAYFGLQTSPIITLLVEIKTQLSLYQLNNLDDENIFADFFHIYITMYKKVNLFNFIFNPVIKCMETA